MSLAKNSVIGCCFGVCGWNITNKNIMKCAYDYKQNYAWDNLSLAMFANNFIMIFHFPKGSSRIIWIVFFVLL